MLFDDILWVLIPIDESRLSLDEFNIFILGIMKSAFFYLGLVGEEEGLYWRLLNLFFNKCYEDGGDMFAVVTTRLLQKS